MGSYYRKMPSNALVFFFQAEDGIRDVAVTGVQTCALPISASTTDTYFWRMTPSDDQNGAAFVAWAAKKGYRRVAVVFQNNIGAQGNDPGVVAAVRKSGGTMTTNITIPGDASSYNSVVARVISG